MTELTLSICIVTLVERTGMLASLLRNISDQADNFPGQVEIIVESDNRESPTGTKRNKAYAKATGKYVVSVDDDDEVAAWYVQDILEAAKLDTDAIAINGTMTTNGHNLCTWDISRLNPYATVYKKGGGAHYLRYPNHITPIKRTIAIQFSFPDISHQEDYQFAKAIHDAKAIKTEAKIDRPIYHYKYIVK